MIAIGAWAAGAVVLAQSPLRRVPRLALLRAYAASMPVLAGLLLVAWAAAVPVAAVDWTLALAFCGLTAAAVLAPLRIGSHQKLTVDDAVQVASLLLFGPAVAMLVAGTGTAAGKLALWPRGRRDPWGFLFNTGKNMLSVGLAGGVLMLAGGPPFPAAEWSLQSTLALAAGLAVLYVANTAPPSLAAAIQRGANPLDVWLAGRRVDCAQTASLFAVGVGVALAAPERPWIVLLVALPTAAAHHTLRQLNVLHEKRLVDQTLEAEKTQARLEGALLVARTVAHEINNALSPVVGLSDLLAIRPEIVRDPALAGMVRAIGAAGQDTADRVKRLQQIVRLKEDERLAVGGQRVLDMEASTAAEDEARAAEPPTR